MKKKWTKIKLSGTNDKATNKEHQQNAKENDV